MFYVRGAYNYGRGHKISDGWRGKEPGYSGLFGGGVHIIDLILWLTQQSVKSVFAYGNNIASAGSDFKNFDIVTCILNFENGIKAQMSVNLCCIHPHFHQLEIYGKNATFINQLSNGEYYSEDSNNPVEIDSSAYPGIHKGGLIDNFVETILGKAQLKVSVDEIFNSMAVCFAIEKSVHTGREMQVRQFQL